ncbi:50S ribosomal protein L30 [Flaviflexus massiliensis]|uniref:50S ribosomal protein L30 n=1 Tax=Flaviflexus massiliensis TaxID=1522309 RepID=UPI0006D591A9|nr:50S ribosomal protein L30 [Flaviflexus massiliensis]
MLKITQTKSTIGGNKKQRDTMLSLGLRKVGQSVEREDRPEVRGMINVVSHLVTVEEA